MISDLFLNEKELCVESLGLQILYFRGLVVFLSN